MAGLGTVFNVIGIIVGGLFGMLFGKWIKPRMPQSTKPSTAATRISPAHMTVLTAVTSFSGKCSCGSMAQITRTAAIISQRYCCEIRKPVL